MDTTSALLSESAGPARILTLNRPERLNAFAPGVLEQLDAALDAAAADEATRVVVVTGAGTKAFAAGNDVGGLVQLDPVQAYRNMVAGQQVFKRLHDFAKPTIAMVNGYALGGGFELALACDFIMASTAARFGFPEITLDTMPGWGGTQLAARRMGQARAKEMVLTGRHYTAAECRDFGFINHIVEPEALRRQTLDLAESLAAPHPFAVEMAKLAVNRALDMPLHAGLDFEAASYALNFAAPHARAGLRGFLERQRARAAQKAAAAASAAAPSTLFK